MQISVLNNSFKLCCIIALFFNRSFQFLKSLFADCMFYPTGIPFCGFPINPDSYKLLRKELMAFINFLSNLPPIFGQMEISIFIHGQKTAIL